MSPTPQPRVFGLRCGVVDDPLVDRARLVHVRALAARDLARRLAHDAVGRNQLGGRRIERVAGRVQRLDRRIALAEVHDAIARRERARHLEHRVLLPRAPFGHHHVGAVLAVADDARRAVARPAVAEHFLVVALHRGHRHPHARRACRQTAGLDARHGLEGAPARRPRVVGQLLREGEAGEGGEQRSRRAGLQK